jgi:transcriptional regulator with XRE-family HTH domain
MDNTFYDHEKLQSARTLLGKSQQEIAEEIGVDRQTIYRAEAGKNASYDLLAKLCRFYRIPMTNIVHPFPLDTKNKSQVFV